MNQAEVRRKLRMNDPYDLLEVRRSCTASELKQAYKKMALLYHPDKNSFDGAKQAFSKIATAYENLCTSKIREQEELWEKPRYSSKSWNRNQPPQPPKRKQYDRTFEEEQKQKQNQKQKRQREEKKKKARQQYEEMLKNFKQTYKKYEERKKQEEINQQWKQKRKQEEEQERKQRQIQRNKQSYERKRTFMYVFIFGCVFVLLYEFLFASETTPKLYSLKTSSAYSHKLNTSILQNSYYVNKTYLKKELSEQEKKKIEIAVDSAYLKQMKKQCKAALEQIKKIEGKAYTEKPGKQRSNILKTTRFINNSACQQLFELKTTFPDYYYVLSERLVKVK